ncbi:MAG: hypothetical protein JWP65_742 [Ramlibacter sp.]|jgi:hypothetical protein|nr:hypothetical protein [Ramlibacter sp.]
MSPQDRRPRSFAFCASLLARAACHSESLQLRGP